MFGYIMVNHDLLSEEDKQRYQALYCGLCRRLGERHGLSGRMTLSYDMTFLSMLLASLYNEDESTGTQRCLIHPMKSHNYICSPATDYAADIGIMLSYYKCLDDWHDDRNILAYNRSRTLEGRVKSILWPRQYNAISSGLADLGEMERLNELNPDLPANCFGQIMGELFVREEDEYAEPLRRMGAALGRFIYIMDAVCDLRADIKKERYNPLISMTDTDFTPMLTLLIGECTQAFEALPIERNAMIMKNILYSGVWQQYNVKRRAE